MRDNMSFIAETGPHKPLVAGSNPAAATHLFVWYIIFPRTACQSIE